MQQWHNSLTFRICLHSLLALSKNSPQKKSCYIQLGESYQEIIVMMQCCLRSIFRQFAEEGEWIEEAFCQSRFFFTPQHISPFFITKATPSHALKISGWIVPERRFPQCLYFLPHVKPLSNNLFFQTLHHYIEIEVRAAMKSSFCLQALRFWHTTAQSIHRSSHSKCPIPTFNQGFCSFLTKQLSNLP